MYHLLTIIAVACYAVNGALKALQKGMDLFGAVVIALVTAVGGGTVRDLLLERPIFWVHDSIFIHVGGATATLVVIAARVARPPTGAVPITDALGVALFAVIGAHTAAATGVPAAIAILTGAMTGFVGGIVRDLLCGEVPTVLRRDIHATSAIAGAALYVGLRGAGVPDPAAAAAAMVSTFVVRMVETRWGIHLLRLPLPAARVPTEGKSGAGDAGGAERADSPPPPPRAAP